MQIDERENYFALEELLLHFSNPEYVLARNDSGKIWKKKYSSGLRSSVLSRQSGLQAFWFLDYFCNESLWNLLSIVSCNSYDYFLARIMVENAFELVTLYFQEIATTRKCSSPLQSKKGVLIVDCSVLYLCSIFCDRHQASSSWRKKLVTCEHYGCCLSATHTDKIWLMILKRCKPIHYFITKLSLKENLPSTLLQPAGILEKV